MPERPRAPESEGSTAEGGASLVNIIQASPLITSGFSYNVFLFLQGWGVEGGKVNGHMDQSVLLQLAHFSVVQDAQQ